VTEQELAERIRQLTEACATRADMRLQVIMTCARSGLRHELQVAVLRAVADEQDGMPTRPESADGTA
jgi:hypothetical protein